MVKKASLGEVERYFTVSSVQGNVRIDGRKRLDYRTAIVYLNFVSSNFGSIRITLGESDVLLSSRVELAAPDKFRPRNGILELVLDCSPVANSDVDGNDQEQLEEDIKTHIEECYFHSGFLELEELCIVPGKICRKLIVEAQVLHRGVSLVDVVSIGMKLSLSICEIPKITEMVCDDGKYVPIISAKEFVSLDMSLAPVVVTSPLVADDFIIDATEEEEEVSKGKLTIGFTRDGNVISSGKIGRCSYAVKAVQKSVTDAAVVANKVLQEIEETIQKLRDHKQQEFLDRVEFFDSQPQRLELAPNFVLLDFSL